MTEPLTFVISETAVPGDSFLQAALPLMMALSMGAGYMSRRQLRRAKRKLVWLMIRERKRLRLKALNKKRDTIGTILFIAWAVVTLLLLLTAPLWGIILLLAGLFVAIYYMGTIYN